MWIESGSSRMTAPGVCGPKTMPATMKNGIDGSPTFRPNRAKIPATSSAAPRMRARSPRHGSRRAPIRYAATRKSSEPGMAKMPSSMPGGLPGGNPGVGRR